MAKKGKITISPMEDESDEEQVQQALLALTELPVIQAFIRLHILRARYKGTPVDHLFLTVDRHEKTI